MCNKTFTVNTFLQDWTPDHSCYCVYSFCFLFCPAVVGGGGGGDVIDRCRDVENSNVPMSKKKTGQLAERGKHNQLVPAEGSNVWC